MPIAPENLPFLRFPRVFHVGSLETASRTDRASLEGPCLSVSVHPEEWGHIARVSGTQWALSCPRAIWLDAVALTDAMLAEMTDWAIGKGLGERRTAWRAWYHDGESDDWRYMLCETEEQARDEAEGWHGDPDDTDAPGPDGTAVEPVTAFRLTDHALSLLERWNDPLNGMDALPILYPMLELAPVMPDLAGTWWNETEDPESLSCPRGGILPGRLDMFDIRDPAGEPPPFRREGTPERRPF